VPIPIWQRLLGLLVYVLPWSDAIPFGQHLFIQFPVLQWLTLPALPLFILERGIPLGLGNLLVFFLLFLAVVRNPNVPYFIRFNTLQALLVDIVVVTDRLCLHHPVAHRWRTDDAHPFQHCGRWVFWPL
jgi:hypothetical protein